MITRHLKIEDADVILCEGRTNVNEGLGYAQMYNIRQGSVI